MYANLKQIMRSKGYPASAGDDWTGADTKAFHGFAVRELGLPLTNVTHMMAYPQAFPAALEKLQALTDGLGLSPSAAPIPPATNVDAAVQSTLPVEPPTAPAAAPVAAPVDEPLSLSPQGQEPKQNLEQQFTNGETGDGQDHDEGSYESSGDGLDKASDENEGETPPVDESAEDEEKVDGPEEGGASEDEASDETPQE
jgi:hypothetical protein